MGITTEENVACCQFLVPAIENPESGEQCIAAPVTHCSDEMKKARVQAEGERLGDDKLKSI
ncbi:hypothetical protein KIN20_003800 [Parelaphostrongylus tenuis]|uniref:Uncharacterized protein n=1 Tax=Parelaphostrongylus tenuis TaxID=148309 RepID=A0AAD5QGF0_PARTN|nr:hypothetical protein KIN20_003800 [Parelaphostrongylus tenuis]